MRRVAVSDCGLTLSRLCFGTGSLHHIGACRVRQRLLAEAYDQGFTHFDTAPYYGFGLAERELGFFLKTRSHDVTIATKIGLYAPAPAANVASLWLRKGAGKVIGTLSRPVVDWSISTATASLEESLRRLEVATIDLLLLHQPAPGLLAADEFASWLRLQRGKGNLRAWGIAGDSAEFRPWIEDNHPIATVVQARDSIDGREADSLRESGRELQITYGYLSSAKRASESSTPEQVLAAALRRNSHGSIIVSTRKRNRVAALAEVARRTDAEHL